MFSWDKGARRFRHGESGRFVSQRTIDGVRDEILDRSMSRVDAITKAMLDGNMSRGDWLVAMRNEIKSVHIQEYLLSRGGRNAMTPADWGRIGREVRTQYNYLDRFAAELSTLSDEAVAARARLYTAGANTAYAEGQAAAWNNVRLPARPGDGSTRCKRYCRCSWIMGETEAAITARWTLGSSREKCDDCKRRAREWAPLSFDKGTGERIAA